MAQAEAGQLVANLAAMGMPDATVTTGGGTEGGLDDGGRRSLDAHAGYTVASLVRGPSARTRRS